MSLNSGTRLGPYEVDALIGAGGMGEVYRARDTRLDRIVAIKVLPAPMRGLQRPRLFPQEMRDAKKRERDGLQGKSLRAPAPAIKIGGPGALSYKQVNDLLSTLSSIL